MNANPREVNEESIRAWNANAAFWDEQMGEAPSTHPTDD